MYLLVIDPNERDRQATQRMLAERGHVVTAVADGAMALRALGNSTFDAVLVDAAIANGTVTFVRSLRAEEATRGLYVVVTSGKTAAGDMSSAFLAGADDFIQKPYGREELLGRMEGICRVKRWAAAAAPQLSAVPGGMGAGSSSPNLSGTYELALAPQCSELVQLAAWKSLDQIALQDVAQFFDLPFQLVDEQQLSRWSPASNGHSSSIALTLAREQLEVRLSIETDALSARFLAQRALGDTEIDHATIRDLLGELANTLAGAFSRAAAAEGMGFTAGLPTADAVTSPSASAPLLARWFGIALGEIQLYVCSIARVRPNLRVRTRELREGMVLAHDLTNDSGALLVRAGTRLTSSTVGRVQRMFAGHEIVEVADAA